MTDFIRKLNLLLRTSLPELPLPTGDSSAEPVRLGKNVDREIAALNDRVRDAYAYEAQLRSRADQLQGEIVALDEAADAAVAEGREELARYHIEQMKRTQARLEMTQADLREHQRVTAELVQRVAGLEDAVARARQAQAEDDARDQRPSMEDALRSAREQSEREAPAAPTAPPRSAGRTEDDLDQRIRRLSK
jgi:phage shock protein A